jgi:hypothetical protein
MSLLRDIQDAAIGTSEPIANLLRRCKILAARLGSAEFAKWVEQELNGYERKEDVPSYRVLSVRSLGHFTGPFGSGMKNAPIPPGCIPKQYRELVDTAYAMQPIGAYEDLLRKPDPGSYESPWPPDLTAIVGQDIYENMACVTAWQEIPRGGIVGLIDSVRNKVLSFAIDIERLSPNAGESSLGEAMISSEKVQQVFHTTIYGNVGNVAPGASHLEQTVGALVTQGDYVALTQQLKGLGITEPEIAELKDAMTADQSGGHARIGKRIGAWLGRMVGRAGEGALKVSVQTATALLPKLISGYLGLPLGA